MRVLSVLLCLLATGANAQDALPEGPALTAETFDAATRGKRMDTYDPVNLYGVEEFLPGQRSIWKDESGCMRATWEQVGDQICFTYESRPDAPDCWVYKLHEGALWGWYQGQAGGSTVRLLPGTASMECDWLGV